MKAQAPLPSAVAVRALEVPLRVVMDRRDREVQVYEAELVLVRSDPYVAWAGDVPPSDTHALLRRVARHG